MKINKKKIGKIKKIDKVWHVAHEFGEENGFVCLFKSVESVKHV